MDRNAGKEFRQYAGLLRRYLRQHLTRVLALIALLLAGVGLQLIGPQILRDVIDGAVAKRELRALTLLALAYLGVGIGSQVLSALSTWLGADVGWRVTNRLREELMQHVLKLDMTYHHEKSPGEFIERIDGDVSALSNFFSTLFISLAGGLLLGVGVLALFWVEHPYVGLGMTLFTVASTLTLFRARHIGLKKAIEQRETSALLFGFLEERLSGLEDIRANGAGGFIMDGFYRINHRFFHVTRTAWMLRMLIFAIAITLFAFGDVLSLALGAWLHQREFVTIGTVILLFRYTALLRQPIETITRQIQDLQSAAASLERITETLRHKSALEDGPGVVMPAGAGHVEVRNLTFAYHADHPVLDNVSFSLAPGHHLGLLGRTGSGKTTLTRLLSRLYDPQQGGIWIDGINIRQMQLEALRNYVGVVTQSVQVFNASVRDNLTLFRADVSDDHIMRVLDQLGLGEWLRRFDTGLDTLLEGGGRGLSSGEAQLLALVRVFLQDPKLVILDEPSSRLDPHTDALLQRAMRTLLAGRSAIIIAHRLSTVQHVDDILILHDSRVVEHGRRVTLEAIPTSRFAALLKTGMEGELA